MTRTIEDWVNDAAQASSEEERDNALERAMASATECWEWRQLVKGLLKHSLDAPAFVRRALESTKAAAVKEANAWGFRDVAVAHRELLDDTAGGLQVLRDAQDVLQKASQVLGLELLARAFAIDFTDVEGARRALGAGRTLAREPGDLANLAGAYERYVKDAQTAREILSSLPDAGGVHEVWTIANAWHELGDRERSHAVLTEALEHASSLGDVLTLARAWSSHDDPKGASRALEVAEGMARTADDWVELAETVHDLEQDKDRVRGYLERAVATPAKQAQPTSRSQAPGRKGRARRRGQGASPVQTPNDAVKMPATGDRAGQDASAAPADDSVGLPALDREDLLRRVAVVYSWLGDQAKADAVAARGVRPQDLRPSLRQITGCVADAAGLLDALRVQLSEPAVKAIAKADYGMDFRKHRDGIRHIVATGLVPPKLGWYPGEVLRLVRWGEGDEVDHPSRAFCVAVLCLCSDSDFLDNNAPILVASCLALGEPFARLGEGLLTWCYETVEPSAEQLAALMGLALLQVARSGDGAALANLAETFEAVAASVVESGDSPWDALCHFAQRGDLWEALVSDVLAPQRGVPAVARILSLLGR